MPPEHDDSLSSQNPSPTTAAPLSESVTSELLAEARRVRENAFAPYSHFKVGAAVLTRDGRVFPGCNVESSSYGLSMCAERNAISRAVADGAREVVAIAIVADTTIPCPPCGACRQLISDLGPDADVIMSNLAGQKRHEHISVLLPGAFTAAHLAAAQMRAGGTG